MGEVVKLVQQKQNESEFDVTYILDESEKIVAVGCKGWPFVIRKSDDGDEVALVDYETGEPFGILDRDQFNTILMCWLLVDDPNLIDEAKDNTND